MSKNKSDTEFVYFCVLNEKHKLIYCMKKELLLACSLCWGMLLNAERMEKSIPFIMQDLIRSRYRIKSIP